MKTIAAFLGGAAGLAFSLLMLFSLPLNVIAMMHFFGWEWWSSLIVAILMNCIPLLGQIAFVGLAISGAFFLFQSGFDWRKATASVPETYNISSMSQTDFARFKTSVVRPQIQSSCLAEAKQQSSFDGKITDRAAKFCDCYAGVVVDVVSREDMATSVDQRSPPAAMREKLNSESKRRCL